VVEVVVEMLPLMVVEVVQEVIVHLVLVQARYKDLH
jgi:hypothetical protein